MHSLKTIKVHTLKAHLDRLQNTAEELASWAAGEVLAGRLHSSMECSRLAAGLLNMRAQIEHQAQTIRGQEPAEN